MSQKFGLCDTFYRRVAGGDMKQNGQDRGQVLNQEEAKIST
jgi:hypothetical protein